MIGIDKMVRDHLMKLFEPTLIQISVRQEVNSLVTQYKCESSRGTFICRVPDNVAMLFCPDPDAQMKDLITLQYESWMNEAPKKQAGEKCG